MFLDVGCGPSALTTTQGRYFYGIDPILENPVLPARAVKGIAEDLPFFNETFDGIMFDKVVGYYPNSLDYWQAISEMLRVLKVGRQIFVATGMHMTHELYYQTEERITDIGHQGHFNYQGNFYIIHKASPRYDIDKSK